MASNRLPLLKTPRGSSAVRTNNPLWQKTEMGNLPQTNAEFGIDLLDFSDVLRRQGLKSQAIQDE